jgi:aryl-alcohol dehydrogenase
MAASIVGAKPIIGVDIIPWRLELASQLGATHTVDARREDVAARVAAISAGGVDYCVEGTGSVEMERLAVDVLRPKGRVALLTGAMETRSFPGGRKAFGVIQGDAVPRRFIPRLIDLYRAGRFPFDRLVKFYPFSAINRAITDARIGDTIKPVLRIGTL